MDWLVHRNECFGSTLRVDTSQSERSSVIADREIEPEDEGEYVVLHGLKAKPELNGRVGVVCGNLNTFSRYPVKLEGKETVIAVKPTNIYRQFGVVDSSKDGKGKEIRMRRSQTRAVR